MLQEVEDVCVRFLVARLEARDILKHAGITILIVLSTRKKTQPLKSSACFPAIENDWQGGPVV